MIIFDLDGTLADCQHRRPLVDPNLNIDYILQGYDGQGKMIEEKGVYSHILTGKKFKPLWKEFFEACDKDKPILHTMQVMRALFNYSDFTTPAQIWSSRCESVRDKTEKWLEKYGLTYGCLKMRPIGDSTPDDILKEKWLDEALGNGEQISFVVDDRPKVVRMWRRRGIYVFDVNQSGKDF